MECVLVAMFALALMCILLPAREIAQTAIVREPLVGSYRQDYQAYGQHGMPTDPYAIIHRNGADCQIAYVASQRRA